MRADLKEWMLKTSEELQGLGNKVLLWTNESPFSEFGTQTILTGNVLQGYDAIEIESYGYVTNSSNRQTTLPIIIHMNETGCMQSGAFGGSNYASGVFWFATRKVTPSSSGIVFDNAYGGYPNNGWAARNDMCVPYRIYGLKFGATGGGSGGGTSDYEDLENKPTINGVTLVEGLVTEDLNLGDTAHEEVTQAEFDALTPEQKDDGTVYFVRDGIVGNVFLDDNTPIGTIAPYGGTSDPSYWLICDGRAISRTDYAALFSVIGTTYGAGDGSTTFNIPDFTGNVAVGASTTLDLGDTGGESTHVLVENELPTIDGYLAWHGQEHGTHVYHVNGHFYGTRVASQYQTTGATSGAESWADVGYKFGNDEAHNNMQPYVVTNYIIKYDSTISRHQANIDFFYPVGSYYETSNADFDPNVTWGGTWVLENEGQVHVSAGSNYEIGDTGGEATHTLTVTEMPSHNHSTGYPSSNESSSGYAAGSLFSGRILVTGAGATGNQGGGQAHNNMQPYIVVNRWHRTA